MAKQPDVLILGGGVIGLTAAFYLSREHVRVEMVDKGEFGQEASWAGAGIIPPGDPERAQTPLDRLRAHSSALFPVISEELQALTSIDNGYVVSGGLVFGDGHEEMALAHWRAEGIELEEMDAEKLRRSEPALAPEQRRTFFLRDMAQVRNPRHLKALLAWCERFGVKLHSGCAVHGFEREGERITGVNTARGVLRADRYLLSAGAWSEALLEQVGWRPGIHPVRGQIALLNTGAPLLRHILLDGLRYLVPRLDGRVLVGSNEEAAGFDKRTTARAIAELLTFAIDLVPNLGAACIERCWAGLRPGSPDGLPFLGAVPGCANLYIAAGHYRAGIQLSPATGLVMKEVLLGQEPTVPLDAFRLDRPPAPLHRPAFRS